jgi:hypothetical protein
MMAIITGVRWNQVVSCLALPGAPDKRPFDMLGIDNTDPVWGIRWDGEK